jgi:hypothetical protein
MIRNFAKRLLTYFKLSQANVFLLYLLFSEKKVASPISNAKTGGIPLDIVLSELECIAL